MSARLTDNRSSGGLPAQGTSQPAWLATLDWRVLLALGATYLFFGSGPAAAKAALVCLPPLGLVAVRGLLAGTVLLTWAVLSGTRAPTRREWASSAGIGVLILALGAGCGTVSQRLIPSGVAGVLSALLPLVAACLAYALFREGLPRRGLIGLLVGFAGVGLLLRPGSELHPLGVALMAAGQAAWALGAVLAPRIGLPEDPRVAAGAELLGGGAVMLAAALALRDFDGLRLGAVAWQSWLGFGWLVLSAVVGFTAYGYLARTVAPSVATTFSYVNPVIAIVLGWALFGEPVTVRMMLATAVIVAGVCLIVSTRTEGPQRAGHHPMTSGHGHVRVVRASDLPRPRQG